MATPNPAVADARCAHHVYLSAADPHPLPVFMFLRPRAVPLDYDGIIRAVRSNKATHGLAGGTPVPLVQMIDILTEVWEIEGLRKL